MNAEDVQHDLTERAAIREHDGEMSRHEADKAARGDMLERAVHHVMFNTITGERRPKDSMLDIIEWYEEAEPDLYRGLRASVNRARGVA